MRLHRSFATLALALAAVGAHAQSKLDCKDVNNLSEQEMTACAYESFNAQDRELNQLYRQLMKKAGADSGKQLQAAQRAWLQFRDLECVYESPDAEGSLGRYETATCQAELTKERLLDFKRMLRDVR